ncbi:MAG: response regulator [Elusimicrobiota bacterium]
MSKNKKRALIVEDDPSLARIFPRFLGALGWSATVISNADAALRVFEPGRYDLALIGVGLGDGMDGVALAGCLRNREPSLRIMLTSGDPSSLVRAEGAGFHLCLPQPFTQEELQALIESPA